MPILVIILVLAAVGGVLWLINRPEAPIHPTIKWIITVIAILAVVIWLLQVFGIWGMLMSARV